MIRLSPPPYPLTSAATRASSQTTRVKKKCCVVARQNYDAILFYYLSFSIQFYDNIALELARAIVILLSFVSIKYIFSITFHI